MCYLPLDSIFQPTTFQKTSASPEARPYLLGSIFRPTPLAALMDARMALEILGKISPNR